jgi:signal transduction histidine kinase
MRFLRQSRLTARILFWVICTSVLMFSVVTALTILPERERMYRTAQDDAARNVSRSIAAISIALWNFDKSTMDATLLALTRSGSIIRAEVRTPQELFAEIDKVGPRTKPDSEWEVPIMGPDDSRQIGTLKISESYAEVRAFFASHLGIELVSELTKIRGLAALLFIVIYYVIARHLRTLAREVANLKPGYVLTPVKLHRKKIWHDELDTLVDSINRFRAERGEAEEALHRDIAERLKIEAALSKTERDLSEALEIAQLAYWEYSLTSKEFVFNDQYYSLCRTSAVQVGGYRLKADDALLKLIHRDDASAFATYIGQSLQADRADRPGQIEIRIPSTNGGTHWMRVHCKMERTNLAEGARLIGTIQDITHRKLAEDALWSARSELAHVTRVTTMGQIGASLAHEINQPLTAIVANSNAGLRWLARETPEIDEAREALKQIGDAGHRVSEVVASIRTMFKKDSHERSLLDVNAILREVLTMVAADLRAKRVSVSLDLHDNLPTVLAERVQLQQVFLNLFMNAIEAMGSVTRPRLLRIKSEFDDASEIFVAVEDSGTGIDTKDADRIFEAFFTTKSTGMGMGLSICRSIIESHSGRLWASAGITCGTVFHVALPASTPRAAL